MTIDEQSRLTRSLVDVAMGRDAADLVIRQGKWVSVQTGEIISNTDVAIKNKRIAYVGPDASHACNSETIVINAEGYYLVPGLLDAHTHIEMAMVKVGEFVRAVIPHGTTGAFIDPHEFANVLGLDGVRVIVEEASIQPINIWVQMPSCVPSVPGLENSGATVLPEDVEKAMTWPEIIGLGEMMNYPGVYNCDSRIHNILAATQSVGRVVGGHYASPDLGLPFHGYVAAGIDDDHEGIDLQDALFRARQGMKVMLRFNTGVDNLSQQVKAINELGVDPRHFILATDGLTPRMLIENGHMDYVVRHAISRGVKPITAIQMATINTAEHFGVARHVGQIAPGRFGDILLVDDLPSFNIRTVVAHGEVVFDNGVLTCKPPKFSYPPAVNKTVHINRSFKSNDFDLLVPDRKAVDVNVIGMLPDQISTRHLVVKMSVENGKIPVDRNRDLCKVALIERHRGSGEIHLAFVNGFGLKADCAIGSTFVHDSHQILIIGTDNGNMAYAANELVKMDGGLIIVKDGEVIASLNLPLAGLMSNQNIEYVANRVEQLEFALYKQCGCDFPSAITQMTRLGLVSIPELRISDQGLIDVEHLSVISVVV